MNELERQLRILRNQVKRWTQDHVSGGRPVKGPNLKMCPNCGRFAAAGASVCEYCDSVLDPKRMADVDASGRQIMRINPVVVIGLICATMYIGSAVMSQSRTDRDILSCLWSPADVFVDLGALVGAFDLLWVQPWRLITYGFLHGSAMHIFMNMSALAYLGPVLWEHLGTRRFWLVSLATAVGGGLVSVLGWAMLGEMAFAVGFSGALFGYIGALWAYYREVGRFSMAEEYRRQFVMGMVICLLLSFAGMRIDNFAHLGGAVTGWLLIRLFFNKGFRRLGDHFERLLLLALVALYAWGVVMLALHLKMGGLFGH